MRVKSHQFSYELLINSAIDDAVQSDIVAINSIASKPEKERIPMLMEWFNLSKECASEIEFMKLFIVLIEAASEVNKNAKDLDDVTTLRAVSETKFGQDIIQKTLDKYRLIVQVEALNISFEQRTMIKAEMNISRRNAPKLRAILAPSIQLEKSKHSFIGSGKTQTKSNRAVDNFRIHNSLKELDSILENSNKTYPITSALVAFALHGNLEIRHLNNDVLENIVNAINIRG
ncbi:hypothetical protein [Vibrio sp. 1180_3]|uniref:hypothetical protein n=1 Tax=Vibrio sp. 1180_3 TaxID=2528832 RepID=UPI002404C59E|nr:hypothetical protein [Vibrio sp. 1180_3]MDF9399109.1 hypothetical protein [Vibrio sp. 1180_3]